MSLSARIIIAIVGLSAAALFTYVGIAGFIDQNVWLVWVLAAVCLLIAFASIPGRQARIAGRMLAGILFLFMLVYLLNAFIPLPMFGDREKTDMRDAITLFIVWGVPAGFVVFCGFYPRWAKYGRAFDTEDQPPLSKPEHLAHNTSKAAELLHAIIRCFY